MLYLSVDINGLVDFCRVRVGLDPTLGRFRSHTCRGVSSMQTTASGLYLAYIIWRLVCLGLGSKRFLNSDFRNGRRDSRNTGF